MVPTFTPFFFHWNDGDAPPLMAVAVNVTLVVGLTDPVALDAIDTDAVTLGFTVTVTGAVTEVQPEALVTVAK